VLLPARGGETPNGFFASLKRPASALIPFKVSVGLGPSIPVSSTPAPESSEPAPGPRQDGAQPRYWGLDIMGAWAHNQIGSNLKIIKVWIDRRPN
jgi:hypothetical protein